jgi:hypothetical protein
MILKMLPNLRATSIVLMSALLVVANSCRTAKPILQSVIVKDTVIVTETKYLLDTLEVLKDTVIYQDKVRLQMQYVDRRVVVEATCLPDTVRVTQTKIVAKEQPKRDWNFDKVVFSVLFLGVFAYSVKRWIDKLTD